MNSRPESRAEAKNRFDQTLAIYLVNLAKFSEAEIAFCKAHSEAVKAKEKVMGKGVQRFKNELLTLIGLGPEMPVDVSDGLITARVNRSTLRTSLNGNMNILFGLAGQLPGTHRLVNLNYNPLDYPGEPFGLTFGVSVPQLEDEIFGFGHFTGLDYVLPKGQKDNEVIISIYDQINPRLRLNENLGLPVYLTLGEKPGSLERVHRSGVWRPQSSSTIRSIHPATFIQLFG